MARLAFALVLVVFASLLAGCSASLFKVKPVTELSPLPNNTRSSDAGGVTVLVAPLLTDEESQELFEANLPLCGVLPLRVALDFQSGVSLDIARARFRLRDNQGRQWKLLSTKQAISRILTANGVSAYNPNSRKQSAEELGAYALDLKTPISASEPRRQGFLFFQSPDKRAIASNQQLVLTVERLPQTATINLN